MFAAPGFQRQNGLEPRSPKLTSNPQPPFTVEYASRSSILRQDQIRRRLKLALYAFIAGAGFWIAAQFIDLVFARFRP